MANWTLRLAAKAEQDIADILAWTTEQFSRQQAEVYAETLSLALEALLEGPDIVDAQPRHDIAPDIHVLHVARKRRRGRHFIAFRPDKKHRINVLRILHDSMDLARHFEHDEQ
ncbi:MAG: type II toxin-antitoxin system RelE/ParE family toxin [Rhodocyclaceae bacterium]|nr:type II toxin-antitoxin system RelE/ParE family toxin [Rhodocyclaceae bacterium]